MADGNVDFDDLLKRLEEARFADEETHSRESSLAERTASRDALMEVRSEMARFRAGAGLSSTEVQ
ncbi:MAG: hypothetical protein BMS9Abin17_0318 [Acidimicrobiia bacterium]|nr:MAG: hypothetical protein BMS9Abin17_0318 [Acidimicrobiia bacterium]